MNLQINTNYRTQYPTFTSRTRIGQKSSVCVKNKDKDPKLVDITSREFFYIPFEDVAPKDRTYDSFTGLRDKNYLLAKLGKSMEYSKCFNKDISIAMFDMDNFKAVNELLGYETGDEFIQVIGSNINSVANKNFLNAYRFGGDEFVIVFDNQNKAKQESIVNQVVNNINGNKYIKSKQAQYRNAAEKRLAEYSSSTEKINNLVNLEMMKSIYGNMRENFATEEAKNDPYLLNSIKDTDDKLKDAYIDLINESLDYETDEYSIKWLNKLNQDIKDNGTVSDRDKPILDEYLKSIYDKTAEMHQIKRWLSDFTENQGFSITGSVVSFDSESINGKRPIELIDIAGEKLKQSKYIHKGRVYC